MRLPPVDVILSWPIPEYEHPVTRGPALIIVNSIFISLVILTVAARLYTRLVIKRWFGWDDIFILFALLFTIGLTTVVLLANDAYGWDRHVWDIPIDQFTPTSKIAMTAKVVFTAAATFTRLSLHCFYYRLVSDSSKNWFKWVVHANVVYTICIFFSFTFIAIFLCAPVKNYWIIGAPEETCMDEGFVTLICGIINCIADLATTITPIPLVLGLQMPRHQRFGVAFLFGMGIIVTVAGIVRTWYIYRSLIGEYDQTWYAYPLWIAAAVEIDLGVICASAPVLRPLLATIPFSLSQTLSGGISFKKSKATDCTSNATTAVQGSQITPGTSATYSSNRRSQAPTSAPELTEDKGQSYELKHWADAELRDDPERGTIASSEAIFEENTQPKKSLTRIWDKFRIRDSREGAMQDMTITQTSEIDIEITPATDQGFIRSSRYIKRPDVYRALPPLPENDR